MPRTGRNIAVGERELATVVDRLSSLYEASAADRMAGEGPERWRDPVWCVGETLAACGGYDLMWIVFQMVEERHGRACGAWLDAAWDGITIPGVVLWSAEQSASKLA